MCNEGHVRNQGLTQHTIHNMQDIQTETNMQNGTNPFENVCKASSALGLGLYPLPYSSTCTPASLPCYGRHQWPACAPPERRCLGQCAQQSGHCSVYIRGHSRPACLAAEATAWTSWSTSSQGGPQTGGHSPTQRVCHLPNGKSHRQPACA